MPTEEQYEEYRRATYEMATPEERTKMDAEKLRLLELVERIVSPKPLEQEQARPILCLDFDGVCHSYTSGWKGADVIPDPPVDGLFDFLRDAQSHFEIHIFSTRSLQDGAIEAMAMWFDEWREKLNYPPLPRPLHFPVEKPPALVTLDDRAITFTGTWPDMKTLRNFKPWNKK